MTVLRLIPNTGETAADVLKRAGEAGLKQVVVIGWDKDDMCYLDSTFEDGPPLLWLLEIARSSLMDAAKDGI